MRLWKEIVCGLVILGSCSLDARAGSSARHASVYSDDGIKRSLRETLSQNPALGQIEPSVSHGTITLTGSVAHYQDKVDAENAARQISGVREVRNQILLTTSVVDDLELEERVEDYLRFARADAGLSFPQIQVEAHRGVVSLAGSVKDPVAHAVVLSLVGHIDGVLSVRDKLAVEPLSANDEAARVRVNKAIYRATRASGEIGVGGAVPVRASIQNGTVTLMGAVADPKTKAELMAKVRDVYGVLIVDDQVLVRDSASTVQRASLHGPQEEVAHANR